MRRSKLDPEAFARAIFLDRLRRVIRLRGEYRDDLNPLGRRLLDRAIDATYQDCIDAGASDAARPIMAAYRRRSWSKPDAG